MKSKSTLFTSFLLLIVTGFWQTALGQKWQPYQFKGNEKFDFRIESHDRKGKTETFYSLDIKATGKKDAKQQELLEVTYTTRGNIPRNELGAQTAFGLWNAYGMSLSMAFLNPAYSMFFTQMDLQVGEKMSFFGAGRIEIMGRERVGGREGFKCVFKQTKGDEQTVVVEWVIDPDLAFPIKSIMYNKGKVQSIVELIKYTKY